MSSPSVLHPVLLIDDNHEDLFLTKRLLSRSGVKHPIMTVNDSEQAIVLLQASTGSDAAAILPCCIFCDVKMPKVNGFAVLKWMREQPRLRHTPFAILTGGDVLEDRERAAALGADYFFVKFPEAAVLKQVVDAAFGASEPPTQA